MIGHVITIDGSAASGKSSVSCELAKRLGWSWVSTGAFYRGLAYVALQLRMGLEDEDALAALAESAGRSRDQDNVSLEKGLSSQMLP